MLKRFTIELEAIIFPVLMVGLMWIGFFLQHLGFFDYCFGAIIPLTPEGLKGIFFSPFLHGNLEHILGNSLPVLGLMFLLFQFYNGIGKVVLLAGWIATGLIVWLLPPVDFYTGEFIYSCIIGASGIVYVLAFFLFFSGIFRWDLKLLAVTLVVGLYYGGLVWGVFPEELFYKLDEPSKVSWQSHLSGAIVGVVLAFMFRHKGEKKKRFIWQYPNYYNEKDDLLWQKYKEMYPDTFQELPQKKKDPIWDRLDRIRRGEE